jgi:hypothetical protein
MLVSSCRFHEQEYKNKGKAIFKTRGPKFAELYINARFRNPRFPENGSCPIGRFWEVCSYNEMRKENVTSVLTEMIKETKRMK